MKPKYDMTHIARGNAVIINNTDFHPSTCLKKRDKSDRDAAALYSLFDDLSFEVILKKNLNYKDTNNFLREGNISLQNIISIFTQKQID